MYFFLCSEKSKRRTKTVAGTLEPRWNQTFIYSPMKRLDLSNRALEITVYDYDRIGSGEYVGEVRWELYSYSIFIPLQIYVYGVGGSGLIIQRIRNRAGFPSFFY